MRQSECTDTTESCVFLTPGAHAWKVRHVQESFQPRAVKLQCGYSHCSGAQCDSDRWLSFGMWSWGNEVGWSSCRAAGHRDRSPMTVDVPAGHCLLSQNWGHLSSMRKVLSKDWWNRELTQKTSLKFCHQVLASVSFQSPGAKSQMSHHICVSETKAQNTSGDLSPVLPSILDLQPLYWWQSTEKRQELFFPTEWLFLLSQQKHQQRCPCLHLVASQTFPVPCHRQLILPLQTPWVLAIKAAASVVLWCVVKLPCYPECAQRGCLIYHCSAFTLGHHPSLPP